MLHIRRFGSQGESLPLPEWTEDRQRFLEWATLPLNEALPGVALTKAKPSTAEQWIKHCEAVGQTTSHALAWVTPTPTGYALGWHNHRVFIEPHAPGGNFCCSFHPPATVWRPHGRFASSEAEATTMLPKKHGL